MRYRCEGKNCFCTRQSHTFRRSFASHLLQAKYDMRNEYTGPIRAALLHPVRNHIQCFLNMAAENISDAGQLPHASRL